MSNVVAPDGSPVEIYLALPAGETPNIIDSAVSPNSAVLELGSGPGRITHPLIEMGHHVTAVDDSPDMLEHVRGAETIVADGFELELGRSFDAVVAASHFINAPERDRRLQLLETCRRHVNSDGVVLVERYNPEWAADPSPGHGQVGDVTVDFEPIEVNAYGFSGRVTYTLGSQSWAQEFSATSVSDDMLRDEAEEAGLRLAGWLDEGRTWAKLVPLSDRR